MKPPSVSTAGWVWGLWGSFFVTALVFVLGTGARVDFSDPSVSISEAFESIPWSRMLPDHRWGEFHPTCVMAVAAVVFFSFHRSWRARLWMMTVAFLTPVLTLGVVMLGVAVVAPGIIWEALAGKADGEFYCEGMLKVAAVGLWMDVCLVFAARELWLRWRKERAGLPNQP